jgi:hypothetical protein
MLGPLTAAGAAFLLAAPAGAPAPPANPSAVPIPIGSGPPATSDPVLVPRGAGAVLIWSGTSDAAPAERELLARDVDGSGAVGPVRRLTREGRDGDDATAALAPAAAARADGSMVMAYVVRSRGAGGVRRTIRVRGAAGSRTLAPGRLLPRGAGQLDAAPALAWGPGRRWALVAWTEIAWPASSARVVLRRIRSDGVPLGAPVVVDRRIALHREPWTAAAPTVATVRGGVLVVWARGRQARLRAVRVGAGGRRTPVALGIGPVAQRRALEDRPFVRRGAVGAFAPRLLSRAPRAPVLVWTAASTPTDVGVLAAVVGRPRVRRLSQVYHYGEPRIVVPTSVVAEPGGTIAVGLLYQLTVPSPGCATSAEPFALRLTPGLRPIGAPLRLAAAQDPRGPDEVGSADLPWCGRLPGAPALAPVAGGLLAAYPFAPYLDGRLLTG